MPRVTPAYIKVDANGHASGVFPGGVEIPTPPNIVSIGDSQRSVTWARTEDGIPLAQVSGIRQNVDGGQLWLSAFRKVGYPQGTSLSITQSDTGYGDIYARVGEGAFLRKILDSAGKSDFVTGASNGTWTVYGLFSAAYNIPASSSVTIDVPIGVAVLGGVFVPIIANLSGFAADRINMPAYSAPNPTTLRLILSTDWTGGAPNGTIWFAILSKT